MEEVKNSEPKPCRVYCENDSCNKPRKHFCSDHNEVLCNGCFTALHVRCKCDEIPEKEDVVECLEVVKTLLTSINENSNSINARSYIKNFEEEFDIYTEKLEKNLIKELQKTLIESSLFAEFTKLKELKLIAKGDNLSRQVAKDIERSSMQKDLLVYKEKVIQEIEEHNRKKIEKRVKEETKEIISKSKQTIRELKDKFQEEEKIKEKLTKKNSKLTKELKKQTEELETERKRIQDMLEEQKQTEEKEQKDRADRFNEIYQKHNGSKIEDLPDFLVEIDLSDSNQKALIKDIVTFKFRLPDIKSIKIYNFSDSESDLVDSFLNWTPNHLKDFYIHYIFTPGSPIKYKLDINSLSKAVAAVTEQVYIRYFEFSAADLQQLIRAACNAEQIIICWCSVHCSAALDFGAAIEYKTNYLSFDCCGYTGDEDLTTDWKADPSCFSNIVDAIGSSGLRHSLTNLSIDKNDTLEQWKVKKMLYENGMGHIKVFY